MASSLTNSASGGIFDILSKIANIPGIKETLFGKPQTTDKANTASPEMQQLLEMIMKGIKGEGELAGTYGGFNEEEFNKGVAEPALKHFQDKILPLLQHKFIANGTTGGSSFQKAQAQAGSDLQSQLAQLMYNAQQQQKQNTQSGVNSVLGTRTHENIINGAQTGAIPAAIQGLVQQGGKAAGAALVG